MRSNYFSMLFTIILLFSIYVTAVDSTAFHTFIKNVSAPQSEITLDSISGGRSYYSGKAYFDIETPGTAVSVHVYLEEVPFEPYVIYTQKHFHGNGKFINIDSLSTGDIGLLLSKKQCVVRWSYSTTNAANHCRIKIGTGNFLYAKSKDSLEGQTRWIYKYNNIGIIASTQIDSIGSGSIPSHLIIPKYTLGGQRMIDDTGSPFAVNGYDNLERMTFTQEASQNGYILHFIYGYTYDEKNRAIQKQQLPFGSTPKMPGTPFKVDTFSYDSLDRLTHENRPLSYIFNNPIFWPTSKQFNVIIKTDYYYDQNSDNTKQSFALYYDKDRNLKPLCSITQDFLYNSSGKLDSSHTISRGLDTIGNIYGPTFYDERRDITIYDAHGYDYKSIAWERHSPDSSFQNLNFSYCYRREYDNVGNVIKQFDLCDSNEYLVWTMSYNEYNAPILQQVPNQINAGTSNIYRFTWELVNLDSAQEYYHE
jgi:hypothetical protein